MTDLLLFLLRRINSDSSIKVINKEYTVTRPLVDAAKFIACEYLIKDINNKQNVNTIVNNGFNIIKKINKFGWKTEYILLNRGKITYNIIFPSYV